jgi:Cu-Zn family superoxide dismutase
MPNTRPARDLETTQPTPGDNGNNGNVRDLTQLTSAVATMSATNGGSVEGEISFQKSATGVRITGELTGLEPGNHGIHVHENGDCSGDKAEGSGGHFAPEGDPHGAPSDQAEEHHVGDLGNLVAEADGTATVDLSDNELTLNRGPNGIIGKALVVHAGEDDLTSQPSGNSGDPLSCGVLPAG